MRDTDQAQSRRAGRGVVLSMVGAVAIGVVAGCGSSPTDPGAPAAQSAAPGGTPGPSAALVRVTAEEFRAVTARPGVVLLDVRTPQEYADGHLAGAINIDVENPDFSSRVARLERSASYAVYCRSGNRSQLAARIMVQAGLSRIVELDGGVLALQRVGAELVKD
ncbi:MAG TPA: rhodanese-like domain-containing protein [Dermatophilaceae bacterium]|nr:rhodanese-like domain-containing protein [Dermatophilaceae bacterium]